MSDEITQAPKQEHLSPQSGSPNNSTDPVVSKADAHGRALSVQ